MGGMLAMLMSLVFSTVQSEDVDIIKGRAAMQQKRAVSDTAAASGRTSTYRSLVPAKTLR
jgi:hypothetical protein